MITLNVMAVNDEPSFAKGADETILEDAGAQTVDGWATALSKGPADEAGQKLSFNITSNSNPGLFSAAPAVDANGDLTYTAAADANGSAVITLNIMDDGGTLNGGDDTSPDQTFTINVTAVNDAPVFTLGFDPAVESNSGPTVVSGFATGVSPGLLSPPDEAGQTLGFIPCFGNARTTPCLATPALSPGPRISWFSFRPCAGTLAERH